MRNGKRDYKRENALYNSRPEQVKNRTERNAARRQLEKEGLVHKGDGKDVAHRTALSKGGSNSRANVQVESQSGNRSFQRNADGSLKSEVSKKEKKRK